MSTIYPSLAQEFAKLSSEAASGIKNKKSYNVDPDGGAVLDVALNDPGLTPNEINSVIYKNDFKKFRETLSKDIAKYHSLEVRYGKVISLLSGSTWLLGFVSFILSGIDAIMSSMISNANTNLNNSSSSSTTNLSQAQFNYAMLITNWLDIIFLVVAGLIQVFSNRIQGTLNKHTAHKTKAREYINILQVDFDGAYSDKIITTDEMKAMNDLQTNYETEQTQISLSGAYYTSNGGVAVGSSTAKGTTSNAAVYVPMVQPTTLNPTQQSFLTIMENLGKNTGSVV